MPSGPKLAVGTGFTRTVRVTEPVHEVALFVLVNTTMWFPGPKVAGLKLEAVAPLMVKELPGKSAVKVTAGSLAQYSVLKFVKAGFGTPLMVMVLVTLIAQPAGVTSFITTVWFPMLKEPGVKLEARAPSTVYVTVFTVPAGRFIAEASWQYALFRKARLGVGIGFTTIVLVAVTEQLSGAEVVVTETVWLPTPKVAGLKAEAAVPLIVNVLPVMPVNDTEASFRQ